jgi:hypothetical protein
MGLSHVKKGTPVVKALPDKSKLKDVQGICLDFCLHGNFPHQLCKNGKHYTNWKNVPNKDKLALLSHMNETGLRLDAQTFKKHKQTIRAEYAHLLGNAIA